MSDERIKILNMIAEGKISPEEGSNLLKALETGQPPAEGAARWLIIRVYEQGSNKHQANVRLPVRLAGKLLKFANRFVSDADIDMEEIYAAIAHGEPGKIMEVYTDDDTRVEIYLEV